jgi:hypothetical protein
MKGEGVSLISPLECGPQLMNCFINVPQGEDFLSILLDVLGEEGKEKVSEDKKQDALLTSLMNMSMVPPFKVDATLGFKQISIEEGMPQKTQVQKDAGELINVFVKLSEASEDKMQANTVFEKAGKEESPYKEFFMKSPTNSENKLLKEIIEPFEETQLDDKDMPSNGQDIEQKVSQKHVAFNLTLDDKRDLFLKENTPTLEGHQKVESGHKEEKSTDDLQFYNPLHKEDAKPIKQEDTKAEAIRRQEPIINHEPKQINMKLEEAFLRLNLFGDKIRLSINLKEEAYRQPTEFEVQRLVQSLQNLGLNLEVLKLNGSMLYYSDQRQNKREDRERGFLSAVSEGNKVSKEEKKSFSLYL